MDINNSDVPIYQPIENPEGAPPAPIPFEPQPQAVEIDVFWLYNVVVEDIRLDEDIYHVTVVYEDRDQTHRGALQSIELLVSMQMTRLFDEERGILLPTDLEIGMILDVLISSRMTMSMPPQAIAYQIIVVATPLSRAVTTGSIMQVNIRNNFLLIEPLGDPGRILRISITSETVILNRRGRRIRLQELYPYMQVRVEHAQFMTANIPPQTTGFLIHVI